VRVNFLFVCTGIDFQQHLNEVGNQYRYKQKENSHARALI